MRLAIVTAAEPEVKPLGLGGDLESNLREVSKLGYDGVELFIKDPGRLDGEKVKELTERFDLRMAAISTGLTYTLYGLSLSSPDKAIREKALKRVEEYLRIARDLESCIIIGSIKGKVRNRNSGIRNLKDSLMKCAESAEETGTRILIEPLNRYESNLINTIYEAIKLKEELDSDLIGVMADTFHMNIEEKSIYNSIVNADGCLEHIHFSDSNRLAPGQGHLDFRQIIHALEEIDYEHFATAEILPLPNQYDAAKLTIDHLKSIR